MKAICFFPSPTSFITKKFANNLTGYVYFEQLQSTDRVLVKVVLQGLPNGTHGFHIHENSLTPEILKKVNNNININLCNELGGHFNPYNVHHGSYKYDTVRHAGDLINNLEVKNNSCCITFVDNLISLFPGINNIINRSIVIHEEEDDCGIPGIIGLQSKKYESFTNKQKESLKTGNAGKRIACGNIVLMG